MVKALLVMSLGGHLLLRSIDYFLCGKYPRQQSVLDKNIKPVLPYSRSEIYKIQLDVSTI